MDDGEDGAMRELQAAWPNATLLETKEQKIPQIDQLFHAAGSQKTTPLHLHLKGTNFQLKVWEALLKIPVGYAVSYQEVATMIGNPAAVRAVASAVAKNPVSFIIPCHRVIRKMGKWHAYRWGSCRKKAMIGWEAATRHKDAPTLQSV